MFSRMNVYTLVVHTSQPFSTFHMAKCHTRRLGVPPYVVNTTQVCILCSVVHYGYTHADLNIKGVCPSKFPILSAL